MERIIAGTGIGSQLSGVKNTLAASIVDYRWLVSDVARPWLALAREELSIDNQATAGDVLVKLTSQLRKDLSAERAHLVIEQIELRQRASEKFSLADQMFFTRKGLEQATDEQLAAYKASRFPPECGAIDLCCGIGGDLLAIARTRPLCWGFDVDPVMVELARTNLALLPPADYIVVGCDACAVAVEDGPWHCDPDRRNDGRRTTTGEFFLPPLESLEQLLHESDEAAIKLASATEVPADWTSRAELEWLSSRGECRQQVAWFGPLARHPGRHAATVVGPSGHQRTVLGMPGMIVPQATVLGRYIYEPDASVLAAKLSAALCQEHSLAAISPGIAYFTSDALIDDLALDRFEIIDVLPLDRKQLRAYCREHGLGRLEIKKRGVDLSPDRLRRDIAGRGDNAATIIVAPVQSQIRAIIARRISE
jgi:THUMP domain-like